MVNNRYERCEYLQNSGNGFEIKDSSRHKATDYFLLDSFAMYNGGNGFRLDTTAGGLIRGNHMYSNRAADISINIASQSLRIVENYMEDNFARFKLSTPTRACSCLRMCSRACSKRLPMTGTPRYRLQTMCLERRQRS
jgi:hypothetical protein